MPATSATSWTEIDLIALEHNVRLLRELVSPSEVGAVVKADAYGHGAITVAQAALDAGAAMLCVFTVREAVELRGAGIDGPILCMGPLLHGDAESVAEHDISVVVDSPETAKRLADAAINADRTISVQLNLDTGMQRYGADHDLAVSLAAQIRKLESLQLESVFTHFPEASNPERGPSLRALRRFNHFADQIGAPQRHAAASAAMVHLPESRLDVVRAGIALYGVDPAPELPHSTAHQLQPVLSWYTTLLAIRDVPRGDSVSYGGLWTAERDSRIGVTGVGYADGLARAQSPGGEMLIRGSRSPIRGAVCMDSTMIDLTEIPDAAVGDRVTIIGVDGSESITAWDLARRSGTIPYEILTSIAARVPRLISERQRS